MEWKVTGPRLGGAQKLTAAKKPALKSTAAPLQKGARDRLELSQQVMRVAEQMGRMGQEEKEGESGSSLIDGLKKQLDIMNKCAKISASISAGDRVPPEDLRYLKRHDMNAYRLAMVTRKPKHDPKDKESVLSEEDIKEMENPESATAAPEAGPSAAPVE